VFFHVLSNCLYSGGVEPGGSERDPWDLGNSDLLGQCFSRNRGRGFYKSRLKFGVIRNLGTSRGLKGGKSWT